MSRATLLAQNGEDALHINDTCVEVPIGGYVASSSFDKESMSLAHQHIAKVSIRSESITAWKLQRSLYTQNSVTIPTIWDDAKQTKTIFFQIDKDQLIQKYIHEDSFKAIPYFKHARCIAAAIFYNSYLQNLLELSRYKEKLKKIDNTSYIKLDTNKSIKILDVCNAGETWLYNLLKVFKYDDINYYTIDIQKSKGKVREVCPPPNAKWFEIIHDIANIENIDKTLLPKSGFDIINCPPAGVDLFNKEIYAKILNYMYDLLSVGGSLTFSCYLFNLPFEKNNIELNYNLKNNNGFGKDHAISDLQNIIDIINNSHLENTFLKSYFASWYNQNIVSYYDYNVDNHNIHSIQHDYNQYMKSHENNIYNFKDLKFYKDIKLRTVNIVLFDAFGKDKSKTKMTARAHFSVIKK